MGILCSIEYIKTKNIFCSNTFLFLKKVVYYSKPFVKFGDNYENYRYNSVRRRQR